MTDEYDDYELDDPTPPTPISEILGAKLAPPAPVAPPRQHSAVGRPGLKYITTTGAAILTGGYRASMSDWDAYERGYITDFAVYTSDEVMPPRDRRSRELGEQIVTQALCGYKPMVAPPPPAATTRRLSMERSHSND